MEFAGIPPEYPPNCCFGEYGGAAFRVAEWQQRADHVYEATTNLRGGQRPDGGAAWQLQRNRESGQWKSAIWLAL